MTLSVGREHDYDSDFAVDEIAELDVRRIQMNAYSTGSRALCKASTLFCGPMVMGSLSYRNVLKVLTWAPTSTSLNRVLGKDQRSKYT